MVNMISKLIKNALAAKGKTIAIRTPKNEVLGLIKKLYPVAFEGGLVRFGPNRDGGYLLPNDLIGIQACFSPGVSTECGFEWDCAERGWDCYLADKSVDGPPRQHPRFHFQKKFVGSLTNLDFMTIDDWVRDAIPEEGGELLLQMDIEGFEYESIISMSNSLLRRFRILTIEFHELDRLWVKPQFRYISAAFDKLLQNHVVVHSHPNNAIQVFEHDGVLIPPLMELTFLRRDRLKSMVFQTAFPHKLDVDCSPKTTIALPKCWYSQAK